MSVLTSLSVLIRMTKTSPSVLIRMTKTSLSVLIRMTKTSLSVPIMMTRISQSVLTMARSSAMATYPSSLQNSTSTKMANLMKKNAKQPRKIAEIVPASDVKHGIPMVMVKFPMRKKKQPVTPCEQEFKKNVMSALPKRTPMMMVY